MMRAIAGAVVLLAVASSAAGAQQSPPPHSSIRVAMPPVDAASQAYYAQAKGFFKKVGLNVDILTVNGGAQVVAAVTGGAADIGQSNVSSLASAHERGIPVVAIAGANEFIAKQHQSALVVAPNAPFKKAGDLAGKTIGVAGLKNITEIGFDKWMDSNGGDWTSVKVVEVPFSTMAEAVASGRIDAAMMTEPELSESLRTKRVKVFAAPLESIGREFVVGTWFSTTAYVKAHPEIIRQYASAMAMAAEWANHHQNESARILESSTKIPVAADAARVVFATRLDTRAMQPVIDASAKYGALKNAFPATDLLAPR